MIDMRVDNPVRKDGITAPSFFQKLIDRQNLAAVFQEDTKKFKLHGRQADLFPATGNLESVKIHSDVGESINSLFFGAFAPSAEHGLDAGDEFAPAEGFCYVVIGSEFKPDDPVHLLAFGREHDDRSPVALETGFTADGETVHPGKHHIEKDKIEISLEDSAERLPAVIHDFHDKILQFQIVPETCGDCLFVFHNQDPFLHFISLPE
jgi:hypothetical protein